jgi:hypothetical protein
MFRIWRALDFVFAKATLDVFVTLLAGQARDGTRGRDAIAFARLLITVPDGNFAIAARDFENMNFAHLSSLYQNITQITGHATKVKRIERRFFRSCGAFQSLISFKATSG